MITLRPAQARGSGELNGQSLQAGDGAAMTQQPDLDFMATSDNTEILLFDLA